jgi:peptide/nickel transport system substrate-binding protein
MVLLMDYCSRSRRLRISLALLLILALVFVSCEVEEPSPNIPEPDFASKPGLNLIEQESFELGQTGGRFRIASLHEPRTFNLVLAEESSSTDITERLQIQLIRRNQFTLEWEPYAAESWEISEDERSILLFLREGLLWSDGTAIQASDWVDGVNQLIYNDQIQNFLKDSFLVGNEYARWEVVDPLTIRISLSEIYAGLLNMAYLPPFPMHILGPILESEGPEGINSLWGLDADLSEIPSSGPFVLKEYNDGQNLLLERNPLYFEKDSNRITLPYLDELEFMFFETQDLALQSYLRGELDYIAFRGEDYTTLVQEKENVGYELFELGSALASTVLAFNQNPIEGPDDTGVPEPQLTWLSDLRFRTALSHLVDREKMISTIALGFGKAQYSFVPEASPYYWPGLKISILNMILKLPDPYWLKWDLQIEMEMEFWKI